MADKKINLTLNVWRQQAGQEGAFETYQAENIDTNASFLEMLDVVNENLTRAGKEPIAFEHDCREGICGSCGALVAGKTHGSHDRTTLCQLHMRSFNDGDELTIEPFRADAFPVIKDLIVDRSALDKIVSSGGYVSVKTGSAPEASNDSNRKEFCRCGNGCGGVHWMWCVCGRLSKWSSDALHFCESFSVCVIAAGGP